MDALQDEAIRQHCRTLRLPTIGTQFARLGEAAIRESQSHAGYLEALLAAELEERDSRAIGRLLHEARLPRMKTLEAFEFDQSVVPAARIRKLAEGDCAPRGATACTSIEDMWCCTAFPCGRLRFLRICLVEMAIFESRGASAGLHGTAPSILI